MYSEWRKCDLSNKHAHMLCAYQKPTSITTLNEINIGIVRGLTKEP